MGLIASRVNRPDVDNLFLRRVCKPSPRKTEQTKRNEDHSKYFHNSLLRRRHSRRADYLLLEYLFNLPDFLLDFACEFSSSPSAFSFQPPIRHL